MPRAGHVCPDGARCSRRDCFFKAKGSHPPGWQPPAYPFGNHIKIGWAGTGTRGGVRAAQTAMTRGGRRVFSGNYNAAAARPASGSRTPAAEEDNEADWADVVQ